MSGGDGDVKERMVEKIVLWGYRCKSEMLVMLGGM